MNFYPEDYIVEVTVPFIDVNGASIVPTAMRAALYDGDDALITDMGTIPIVPSSGSHLVTILAGFNALSDDSIREARVLRIELDTAQGIVRKSLAYIVEAEQTVRPLVNSFMGFANAEMLALDYVNLTGWQSSDEVRRRAALVEAYKRIIQIPMVFYPRDELGNPIQNLPNALTRDTWLNMTQISYDGLPPHFKQALRSAQLLEASEILTGDTISRKQKAGIISETIGESSVTLNRAVVDYGLSKQALSALAGYIDTTIRIARI